MAKVGSKYKVRSVNAEQLVYDSSKEEGKRTNAGEIAEWSGGRVDMVDRNGERVPQVVLTVAGATRVANVGDYVVEVTEDNFTVMSAADFERQYEK